MDRRSFVRGVAGGMALAGGQLLLPRSLLAAGLPSGALESEELYALPGKQPLIKRSFRPPNFETPVAQFSDVITPNDRFFVRWHLASIPQLDPREWRLSIGGDAATQPFELTLEQLQRDFEQVELVAVCQCSGNRRGLSDPHVFGVQWAYGAMGNARWKGVRLKDVLAKAGVVEGRGRGGVQRRGQRRARGDSRFREEHPRLEGDGREHAHRLGDERRAAAALERRAGAHRRARAGRRPTG